MFIQDSNCQYCTGLEKQKERNTEGVSGRGGFPGPTLDILGQILIVQTQPKYLVLDLCYITLET